MKLRGIILSTAAAAIVTVYIVASGGILLVSHTCHMAHNTTFSSYSLVNHTDSEDTCCGTEENDGAESSCISSLCCEFKTSSFSLQNYLTVKFQELQTVLTLVPPRPEISIPVETKQGYTVNYQSEKYGGRTLLNSIHQLIS